MPITIQGGLFNGRAGLWAALNELRRYGADTSAATRRAAAAAQRHLLVHRGSVLAVGDQLLRVSGDLATGSAGILLAERCRHHRLGWLLPGAGPTDSVAAPIPAHHTGASTSTTLGRR